MSTYGKRKGLEERLLDKRNITSSGCWEFTGWVNNKGYGMIGKGPGTRKLVLCHRASYEIYKGPIPEGMFVLHSCDNPPCFNPEHLSVGTHKDNMTDMAVKGRKVVLKGEASGNAKLTKEQVKEIRSLHKPTHPGGRGSNTAILATKYGISKQYVLQLVKNDWRKDG